MQTSIALPDPEVTRRIVPSGALRSALLLGAFGMGLAAAGCARPVDRVVPAAAVPEDYHQRHPVVLANAPQRLDIFFVGADGHLDRVQTQQLQAFAGNFLSGGQSRIRIAVPEGDVDHVAAERTLSAVRRELLAMGIRDGVTVTAYPVRDPAVASPLHLSFLTLQARPTTRCGEWPDDLGSGSTLATWNNRSYYNLGCASQQTLAAQVADPRDLVKPHALDTTDVQLRTRAIESLRDGVNPSTDWTRSNPAPLGPAGQF